MNPAHMHTEAQRRSPRAPPEALGGHQECSVAKKTIPHFGNSRGRQTFRNRRREGLAEFVSTYRCAVWACALPGAINPLILYDDFLDTSFFAQSNFWTSCRCCRRPVGWRRSCGRAARIRCVRRRKESGSRQRKDQRGKCTIIVRVRHRGSRAWAAAPGRARGRVAT